MGGWIKLFYRFKEWEWYEDTNMVRLFIHLLLSANPEPVKWRGEIIPCGSLVTTLDGLAKGTGLSIQNIRTCLGRLVSNNQITSTPTNKYRIITICKYCLYQYESGEANKQLTNNQQTTNKQKNKSKEDIISPSLRSGGSYDLQSTPDLVPINEEKFCEFFNSEMEANAAIIPRIKALGKARRGHMEARCREYGKDALAQMVRRAARSDFLNGQNKRGWKATFDWLILPNNFPKVIEGTYDNNSGQQFPNNDTKTQDRYTKRRGADSAARSAEDYTDTI